MLMGMGPLEAARWRTCCFQVIYACFPPKARGARRGGGGVRGDPVRLGPGAARRGRGGGCLRDQRLRGGPAAPAPGEGARHAPAGAIGPQRPQCPIVISTSKHTTTVFV